MCWTSFDSFCFLVKAIGAGVGVTIPMEGDVDRFISRPQYLKEFTTHILSQ